MKHLSRYILAFGIIASTSCNNQPAESSAKVIIEDTSKSAEMKIMIPATFCYSVIKGKDTFSLKLEKFPTVVTGNLSYQFYEKDSNNGEIDGKLNGDTLIADYKFMSEGIQSTRQVIFLIRDSMATEGYGPMEEKEGKMVFTKLNEVDFSNGIKLREVPCAIQ